MFDGSDLSLAYSSYEHEQPLQTPPMSQPQQPKQQLPQQPPPPPQVSAVPQQYNPSDAMFLNSQVPQQQQPIYKYKDETFIERFLSKRYDVLKVVSFALIIVLAISIDRFTTFYITQYIDATILTKTNEMLFRLSYPVIILVIIWLIKTF